MFNALQRLFDSLRTRRRLLDTIAQQNRVFDELNREILDLKGRLADAEGDLNLVTMQRDSLQDHLRRVTLQANACLDENARLRSQVRRLEAEAD